MPGQTEAATAEDACQLAIQDDDWQGRKEDHENGSATYLTGIWPGVDSAYTVPALALPPGFGEGKCPPPTTGTESVAPPAAPLMPRCRHCGSADICRDANAMWDETAQTWSLFATYDSQTCQRCGADSNNLALWVPVAEAGSATAFLWDVIQRLQTTSLAWDAEFQRFCTESHGQLTADEAAARWRSTAAA